VRLTGGEPLIRKDITSLIASLAEIKGVNELSLTTNGVLLEEMACDLKTAGLNRINVSIDALEAGSYRQITGYDFSSQVLSGIKKAIEVGLQPVKINAVILRGINHSQIAALAGMSIVLPVTVRFIEYCPTSSDIQPADNYVPYHEIKSIVENAFGPLTNATMQCNNGPALYFKIKNSNGAIGFIAGRSTVFCSSCNRIRLTSDGRIKPCLYSPRQYNVRRLIRTGMSDEKLREALKRIISHKHIHTRLNRPLAKFSMRKVGG